MQLMQTFTQNFGKQKKRKRDSDNEVRFRTPPKNAQVSEMGENSGSEQESEGEGFSDGDADDMEDLISNQDNSLINNSNIQITSDIKSLDSQCEDLFAEHYISDAPILHLPPISGKLAENITQWCRF